MQGLARDILLKMCTKQPDSVPEVFAAARKLLQHEDDSIVEHGCTVIFELCDETMDIIEEVIPLMDSESSGVRRLAKKIFSRPKNSIKVPSCYFVAFTRISRDSLCGLLDFVHLDFLVRVAKLGFFCVH